jgi:Domain of unknown function (DUF4350)
MPPALNRGDRKILFIAGSILLALVTATMFLSPPTDEAEGQGVPTTYSTTANGTQAAYLLLRELGYRSERWENPPTELPRNPQGTILIVAAPSNLSGEATGESFPDVREREALVRFVRAGGWIIYTGDFPFLFLGTGSVSQHQDKGPTLLDPGNRSYEALAPSAFTRDAARISLHGNGRWQFSDGNQVPLYGNQDESVVVSWKLDKGRVLWWAAPTPIDNAGIAREGNLAFFLDCIRAARPGASPRETTILWDEYFHGYRGSLWDYFQKTPVPWTLYQLAFVAIFIVLAFSRRSGPLYTPPAESRLSPLEFVDTLGDLYRRARAEPAGVRVAYQRFRTLLLRRLALSSSTSNAQLDTAVRERLGWKQPGFMSTLQRADAATRQSEMPGAEALKIVQALEHYEVLFGLKTRPNEENR